MVETTLIIYALGLLVIILATILGTKAVKRRANKPENIWEGYANPPVEPHQFRAQVRPLVPPPPHMFNNL